MRTVRVFNKANAWLFDLSRSLEVAFEGYSSVSSFYESVTKDLIDFTDSQDENMVRVFDVQNLFENPKIKKRPSSTDFIIFQFKLKSGNKEWRYSLG